MTQIYRYGLLCGLLCLAVVAVAGSHDAKGGELAVFGFDAFDPEIGRRIGNGNAIEKIYHRFGQPRRVEVKTKRDERDSDIINEVKTWHWDGLEIVTWGAIRQLGRWVKRITLTGQKYKLKFGLSIGSPRETFIEKLGPPHRVIKDDPARLVYGSDYVTGEDGVAFGSHSWIYIDFDKQDRAEKIIWEYFTD